MKFPVPSLRKIALLGLLLVSAYTLVALRIVHFGNQISDSSADSAVVLGAAAWGNKPSPVYRERINEAISLYKQGRVQWIIFTGGTPRSGYPSEAEVGRQFSAAYGVPMTAMLVDIESRSTWGNLEHAKVLMGRAGIRSALLVSDPLHMLRAMAMATDLGLRAQPAPTLSSRFRSWTTWGKFLWRETWLYISYRMFGPSFGTGASVDSEA